MGDHLFISYATEDAALADWLTLKLTAQGYKVWCDRFKLLGGERFPRDIDIAIKEKTFRLLSLISRDSLAKENPTKERTLALSIASVVSPTLLYIWRPWTKFVPRALSIRTPADFGCDCRYSF